MKKTTAIAILAGILIFPACQSRRDSGASGNIDTQKEDSVSITSGTTTNATGSISNDSLQTRDSLQRDTVTPRPR